MGRQPKYGEMVKPISKFSSSSYEKKFGSWRAALEKFIDFINKPEETEELVKDEIVEKSITDSWRLRFTVMRRDGFKCVICGRSPASNPEVTLHVDHIVAWSNGGETEFSNLQTLCSMCNIGNGRISKI